MKSKCLMTFWLGPSGFLRNRLLFCVLWRLLWKKELHDRDCKLKLVKTKQKIKPVPLCSSRLSCWDAICDMKLHLQRNFQQYKNSMWGSLKELVYWLLMDPPVRCPTWWYTLLDVLYQNSFTCTISKYSRPITETRVSGVASSVSFQICTHNLA